MRFFSLLGCAAAIAALGACTTEGGAPPPVINAPGPVAAALNTTVGPLGYNHPQNRSLRSDLGQAGGTDVSEQFAAVTTSLRVTNNGTGFEFSEVVAADYESADTVTYSNTSNTLTVDLVQSGVSIQDTIGTLLLADPGDLGSLTNDTLAILIAAFPGAFSSDAGLGFNPATFQFDPLGADQAIEDLKADGSEEATEFLATLNANAAVITNLDFFGYRGPNNLDYSQLKITGTNSGITTNYVALGYWNYTATPGVPGDYFYGTTLWGKPTPDGEIPDTGTATYDTTIVGWMLRQNAIEQLRGGVTLNVDFGARTVDALVDADIVVFGADGESIFTDYAELSGFGEFAANGQNFFSGDLTGDTDPTLVGSFDGQFYGPSAAEVGGTLNFSNSDAAATGSYVGPNAAN